ncbi:MAG: hypothetical protein MJZ82_02950 [Paludibacteraceae bacterium]|nr:hypothetical protein [Paludibacteraceae bacterium]
MVNSRLFTVVSSVEDDHCFVIFLDKSKAAQAADLLTENEHLESVAYYRRDHFLVGSVSFTSCAIIDVKYKGSRKLLDLVSIEVIAAAAAYEISEVLYGGNRQQ